MAPRLRAVAAAVDPTLRLYDLRPYEQLNEADRVAGARTELVVMNRSGKLIVQEMAFSDFRPIARGYYIGDTVDYATRPRGS